MVDNCVLLLSLILYIGGFLACVFILVFSVFILLLLCLLSLWYLVVGLFVIRCFDVLIALLVSWGC